MKLQNSLIIFILLIQIFSLRCIGHKKHELKLKLPSSIFFQYMVVESDTFSFHDFEYDSIQNGFTKPISAIEGQKLKIEYHAPTIIIDTVIEINDNAHHYIDVPYQFEHYYQIVYKQKFEIISNENNLDPNDSLILVSGYTCTNANDYKAVNNIFNNFDNSDTLYVLVNTTGCFTSSKSKISFVKSESNQWVTLKYEEKTNIKYRAKKDISKKISANEFTSIFNDFEEQCLNIPYSYCTTSSRIVFIKGNKVAIFNDNSCQWSGYSDFLENLQLIQLPNTPTSNYEKQNSIPTHRLLNF